MPRAIARAAPIANATIPSFTVRPMPDVCSGGGSIDRVLNHEIIVVHAAALNMRCASCQHFATLRRLIPSCRAASRFDNHCRPINSTTFCIAGLSVSAAVMTLALMALNQVRSGRILTDENCQKPRDMRGFSLRNPSPLSYGRNSTFSKKVTLVV